MRAILTYHSIDESGSVISISETVFRDQITWLARSNVRVVTLDTLMRMHSDADAVERFLSREGDGIEAYLEHLAARNPLRTAAG